jgi:DNA-binding transcriptional regulator LsrR (DeoR family)
LVAEGRPLHVGISGGETLLSFANAVTECQREHVHIYTSALVGRGRLRDEASHVDPLVNATVLWAKCGRLPGHCHYATVPPYDALTRGQIGGELRELLKRQPIREVIADMNRINVAFAGLGLVKPTNPGLANQLTMTGLLEEIVPREALDREGATGDLAYCLFDETGNRSTKYNWEFFLTAGACGDDPEGRGLGFYKQMVKDRKQKKKVIVIAGSLKQPAIGPALKAKLFNVWITDANTARWALRKL